MMSAGEIKMMMIEQIDCVLLHLFPNGNRKGNSFCVGSVHGESGQSFRVCLNGVNAGVWSDFSSDDSGGDLIDLWQQVKGTTFVEALKEIKELLVINDVTELAKAANTRKKVLEKPKISTLTDETVKWFG